MHCFEQNPYPKFWLRFHSEHYFLWRAHSGHYIAQDVHCDTIMGHDVAMGIYHDVTMQTDVARILIYYYYYSQLRYCYLISEIFKIIHKIYPWIFK